MRRAAHQTGRGGTTRGHITCRLKASVVVILFSSPCEANRGSPTPSRVITSLINIKHVGLIRSQLGGSQGRLGPSGWHATLQPHKPPLRTLAPKIKVGRREGAEPRARLHKEGSFLGPMQDRGPAYPLPVRRESRALTWGKRVLDSQGSKPAVGKAGPPPPAS